VVVPVTRDGVGPAKATVILVPVPLRLTELGVTVAPV
jgi:hypothetical protein